MSDTLKIAAAQIAPVWLDRAATTEKIVQWTHKAADEGCDLVAYGEALLPGYPFWLEHTGGARFENDFNKDLHAHYLKEAVNIERGDLAPVQAVCRERGVAIYLGMIERPDDRGGHSPYCSLAYIDADGEIQSVQRKLMPTYEERLAWSIGDGNGLRTHPLGAFTVGGLNCWENWMPLARASLYGQGESLHVAVWPGNPHNTLDLTPMMAKEGRSYALSVSSLMRKSDIPDSVPHHAELVAALPEVMARGASCIAAPDGSWAADPVLDEECLVMAEIDHLQVRRARQSFDPSGHYSRPDVFELKVNRKRQQIVSLED